MARPRVTRKAGRWVASHDCGWTYTSPSAQRAHDEARHHTDGQLRLGPRPLPPDAIVLADTSGPTIYVDPPWDYQRIGTRTNL